MLITGGSLGEKAINDFIFKNIKTITKNFFVLHLVGKNNTNKTLFQIADYKQIEFSTDMWTIFKATDYALSRAGANTIIELLSNQILTIFVPLPKKVSRGDQIENAKYLESKNLSKTIFQEDLSVELLEKKLTELKAQEKTIKTSIKNEKFVDGTQNIMSIILSFSK